ncbi:MAG: 4Fe-4S binding protein [Halanaerobiales bacterium]|nr:4Fe-4S binding protein [Halanaerobiales bacterium]
MEILSVLEATCKDCHRCLRYCPVGAIGFGQDQARIIHDKCIYCGRCINVCPQKAKVPYDATVELKKYLDADTCTPLVASVAPSFIATMEIDDYRRLVGGLKQLGFTYVTETVHGANYVAKEYIRLIQSQNKPLISACCPAIVNLIEKHHPEMIPYLAPVVSPMMAHGQILKQMYGEDIKVIFIGPCLAKMDELTRPEAAGGVDLVLTFRQLNRLFNEKGIDLSKINPADFDYEQSDWPRNYPIRGGLLQCAALKVEYPEDQILAVTGIEECMKTMEDIKVGRIKPVFLEMMACRGGCINGPEVDTPLGGATRRQLIVKHNREREKQIQLKEQSVKLVPTFNLSLTRNYSNRKSIYPMPSEEEIREILKRIGKFSKEDETNCGGCGYKTCREKAIAVFQGLAEEKMCIPFMKERFESLSHVIVESSHNAIIVVDQNMKVQEFNPVANRMFNRKNESPIGQFLYRFIDHQLFQKVWEEKKPIVHHKVKYDQYKLVTDQTIFSIEEYRVIVGIFTDITGHEEQKEQVRKMKRMAIEKTADVVHKQMKVVQEIAMLLGETTVETKAALYELTELIEDGESR